MKRKKNKKVLLVILLIIGLILVGTGTSLAYFSYKEDIGNKILLGDDAFIALEDLPEEIQSGLAIETDIYALMGEGGDIGNYAFTVRGHNTNEKPIYYALFLEHGEDVPGKTRIKDELFYTSLMNYYEFIQIETPFNNFELPIYIGKIDGGFDIDEEHPFVLTISLKPINISDTDPDADYSASTEGVIRNGKPKLSNLFGSFKVKMVASTKEIKLEDYSSFNNQYEIGDSNSYFTIDSPYLFGNNVQDKSTLELMIERPTEDSVILIDPAGNNGTAFRIVYKASTQAFNFHIGRHVYNMRYEHNDNDVVDGIDRIKLIINLKDNYIKVNNGQFSIDPGVLEGSSGDVIYIGEDDNSGNPGYRGKIFYAKFSIASLFMDEIVELKQYDYVPIIDTINDKTYFYEKNTGYFLKKPLIEG